MKIDNLIHKTLVKLTNLFPERQEIIEVNDDPYLKRFHLINRQQTVKNPFTGKTKTFILPFSINLHNFIRPDQDRELHSHPWDCAYSFILSGGYKEERKQKNKIVDLVYTQGSTNLLTHKDFHRIKEIFPNTWTLFITGKRMQEYDSRYDDWGFWDQNTNAFIPHEDFLNDKKAK